MVTGLVLNEFTYLGVKRPLTTLNIFAALDLMTLILTSANLHYLRTIHTKLTLPQLQHSWRHTLTYAVSLILPFLAMFGAFRLNNRGTNLLTVVLFILIAGLMLWLAANSSVKKIYPFSLFCIAVSILFTISLRGWFLTGSDIQREFYVFQLTLSHEVWNINFFKDPYNACLSITILPTLLAKITHIAPPYIYKVLYQMIFGFSAAAVYLLIKSVRNNKKIALLGAFIFMLLPMFITDMSMVNRQEIAFLFFAGLLLTNFTRIFTRRQRGILTLLFLLGLTLSHYSTAYITISLFIVANIFLKLLTYYFKRHDNAQAFEAGNVGGVFNIQIVLIGLLVVFLWNTQLTSTANGLDEVVTSTVSAMFDQSATQYLTYNPIGQDTKSPQTLLNNYATENKAQGDSILIYAGVPQLPPARLVSQLASKHIDIVSLNTIVKTICNALVQIFLVIGLIIMFLEVRRKGDTHNVYLFCLCVASALLLAAQTILPQLTSHYGTSRLLQQLAMVLDIPIVIGIFSTLRVKGRLKTTLATIFIALTFLETSGLIPQLLGGYQPALSLNNAGVDYEAYYVHHSEVVSAEWLTENVRNKYDVEMDDYARLRFLGAIHTGQLHVVPVTGLSTNDYLYNDYSNAATDTYQVEFGAGKVRYTLPQSPSQAKDLVYSDNGSTIYK